MGTQQQLQSTMAASTVTASASASPASVAVTHQNANASANASTAAEGQQLQQNQVQPQQQQQYTNLPKASPAPQVIIIPATQASTVATNAAKKIRRAFSMPRNPFRWSRKFKTTTYDNGSSTGGSNLAISSCVGGGRGRAGSIVSLNSYEAVSKDANGVGNNSSNNNNDNMRSNDGGNGDSGSTAGTTADTKIERKNGKQSSGDCNAVGGNGSGSGSGGNGSNRILRRSSFRKFLNRIAQHVSSSINVGANKHAVSSHGQLTITSTSDRVPPIGSYQWPADQTPGVMGLKNHGNTCFMNAVLQCLSHTDILAEYFVLDQYKADLKRHNKINSRKFGTKGELTEQLANVLKALWTCKNESDHSTSFKAVVDRYGTQFRSSTQQDAQEFLFWLLDKVHEDLNTATKRRYKSVKNTYGRPDEVIAAETLANHIRCNNSFVQAVFQAQFRSSLTCPRCKKQSNTFDPFHCISVQLPQLTQQTIFVTVVYLKQQPRQVKLGLTVPAGSPIVALREQLQADTGIASDRLVLVDINKEGFTRVFYDTQPVATLNGIDTIYCIEVPEMKATTSTSTGTSTTTSTSTSISTVTAPAPAIVSAAVVAPKSVINTTTSSTTTASKSIECSPATGTSTKETDTSSPSGISNTGVATATTTTATVDTVKSSNDTTNASDLLLLVANVRKSKKEAASTLGKGDDDVNGAVDEGAAAPTVERFGIPFCMLAPRDCSYTELQKRLLRELSTVLKPEVFSYTTPLTEMFQIRLQDPSADPDTYLENVEHPLLTEMIDLALSVLSAEAGPPHIKLLLEWPEPDQYFVDQTDTVVEHESVARLLENKPNDTATLSLEQCLEHYTKAETLSAEDAWRCPHCQQYLPVVKTLGLWSLPDILVIHFKRFRQHHEKGANAAKLTTMVKFPLNAFDMSPHLARCSNINDNDDGRSESSSSASQYFRPSPWKKSRGGDSRSSTLNSRDNKETRYDLYAVCYHQGDTLETGHYTAACKNPYDRQWYKFDDQRVSKVTCDNIEDEIINNEAYMLFYQRRAGDAAECSGSSSNSGDHWVSRIVPPPTIEKYKEKVENDIGGNVGVSGQKIEKIPENAETSPIEVPIVKDPIVMQEIRVNEESAGAKDLLAQKVVIKKTNEKALVNIEEIDFVDSEEMEVNKENNVEDTGNDSDELEALERLAINESVINGDDSNQIFAMDEDYESNKMADGSVVAATVAVTSKLAAITKESTVVEVHPEPAAVSPVLSPITKSKTSPMPDLAFSMRKKLEETMPASQKTVLTNGVVQSEKLKSPKETIAPDRVNGEGVSHVSNGSATSSSSSSSSLSSRSSPHSLAVSVHGVSTLQTKMNGFNSTAAAAAAASNYKDVVLLSSSLKSNSSSIISAAVTAHSHEFQLSRHQHNHWNGSRSSVSAVENTVSQQQMQHHTHCLNLRHSFSTSSNYKLRECTETLSSMLRNSANTCSKDTLLFIDQQSHHNHHSLIEDEDDTFMDSRSLWISPVTPHKLITVSPKN